MFAAPPVRVPLRSACLALALALAGCGGAEDAGAPPAPQGAAAGFGDPRALAATCAAPETPPDRARDACGLLLRQDDLSAAARARVHFNRGAAFAGLGRQEAALADFDAAAALDPSLYEIWPARGWALLYLGRAQQSVESFDQAAVLQPAEGGEVDLGRGAALVASAQHGAALAPLERVLAAAPEHSFARFQYGIALKGLGRREEALAAFDRAAELRPDDPAVLLRRADLQAELGRVEAALQDYAGAILLAPDAARPRYARGRYLDSLGRVQEANEDLLRAWRLGWRDEWLDARVKSLGG